MANKCLFLKVPSLGGEGEQVGQQPLQEAARRGCPAPVGGAEEQDPRNKEKYIVLHQQWKADRGSDLEHKYDTMGRSLADIQREGQRQVDLFNSMNRWTKVVKICKP